VVDHLNTDGTAPTIAELASALGVSSRGSLHRYLQSLVTKGYLQKKGRGWRNLELASCDGGSRCDGGSHSDGGPRSDGVKGEGCNNVLSLDTLREARTESRGRSATTSQETHQPEDNQAPNLRIPLLGKIAAGLPIEAISNEEHLDLAGFFIGPDRFALRVTGESMIDAGILDGDTVIVKKQSTAKSGDIIVALIDLQEATLKRLGAYTADSIELIPENSAMSTLIYSSARVSIQGILVGQLRTY